MNFYHIAPRMANIAAPIPITESMIIAAQSPWAAHPVAHRAMAPSHRLSECNSGPLLDRGFLTISAGVMNRRINAVIRPHAIKVMIGAPCHDNGRAIGRHNQRCFTRNAKGSIVRSKRKTKIALKAMTRYP